MCVKCNMDLIDQIHRYFGRKQKIYFHELKRELLIQKKNQLWKILLLFSSEEFQINLEKDAVKCRPWYGGVEKATTLSYSPLTFSCHSIWMCQMENWELSGNTTTTTTTKRVKEKQTRAK